MDLIAIVENSLAGVVTALVVGLIIAIVPPLRVKAKTAMSWAHATTKTTSTKLWKHLRYVLAAGTKARRDARFANRVKNTTEVKAISAAVELHGTALVVLGHIARPRVPVRGTTNSTFALDRSMLLQHISTHDAQCTPAKYTQDHPQGPAILGRAALAERPPHQRHRLLRDFVDRMTHQFSLTFSRQ